MPSHHNKICVDYTPVRLYEFIVQIVDAAYNELRSVLANSFDRGRAVCRYTQLVVSADLMATAIFLELHIMELKKKSSPAYATARSINSHL